MNIYDIIADNYSEIFPLDPSRADFVFSHAKTISGKKTCSVLDLGCATGDFCIDLYEKRASPSGIDLNKKMIDIALNRSKDRIHFYAGDMLEFRDYFPGQNWDSITCFGNTLPHLSSSEITEKLFLNIYNSLNSRGSFTLQMLNYDYILKNRSFTFPDIENENLLFMRKYEYPEDGSIIFTIKLTDKKTGRSGSESTVLLPFTQNFIITASEKAGFTNIELFSDYSLEQVKENSYAVIYRISKQL